jgi:hypothetical protein
MNFKLIKLLAAICAALIFVIACEWMYALYAQKQLLESVGAGEKQKKSTAQLPTLELTKRPETSYTDLVTRPLFIQGRRPVNEPSAEQTPVTNAATETFNWAVNGIYTYQNKLYALLSRTTAKVAKDNYRKVTVDSDVDGWKLVEIQKDKVIVSQGNKQKELPLRKAKPKDASGLPGNSIGNPMIPPPVPNQPGQPGQPLLPGQQPIPVPEPVPEPILEPELIPDESSETFIENDENEQFQ